MHEGGAKFMEFARRYFKSDPPPSPIVQHSLHCQCFHAQLQGPLQDKLARGTPLDGEVEPPQHRSRTTTIATLRSLSPLPVTTGLRGLPSRKQSKHRPGRIVTIRQKTRLLVDSRRLVSERLRSELIIQAAPDDVHV